MSDLGFLSGGVDISFFFGGGGGQNFIYSIEYDLKNENQLSSSTSYVLGIMLSIIEMFKSGEKQQVYSHESNKFGKRI